MISKARHVTMQFTSLPGAEMGLYSLLDENVKMDTGFCEAAEKHQEEY